MKQIELQRRNEYYLRKTLKQGITVKELRKWLEGVDDDALCVVSAFDHKYRCANAVEAEADLYFNHLSEHWGPENIDLENPDFIKTIPVVVFS